MWLCQRQRRQGACAAGVRLPSKVAGLSRREGQAGGFFGGSAGEEMRGWEKDCRGFGVVMSGPFVSGKAEGSSYYLFPSLRRFRESVKRVVGLSVLAG